MFFTLNILKNISSDYDLILLNQLGPVSIKAKRIIVCCKKKLILPLSLYTCENFFDCEHLTFFDSEYKQKEKEYGTTWETKRQQNKISWWW